MTWIKLDDTLPNNPKILPLSNSAFRLYIEGLCYANQYLTDGFLAQAVVKRLDGDSAHLELVDAGLWDIADGGMQIHDYCEHQTSRADVQAKKDAERERVRSYRNRTTQNVRVPETDTETDTENRIQKTDTFDEFWSVYPRKVGKADALKAYTKALKSASAAEILEGATRYAQDPNREPEYTAHPATWLNRGSWSDDPLPLKSPQNGFRATFSAPTILPPKFTADEVPKGVPMPESVRSSLRR